MFRIKFKVFFLIRDIQHKMYGVIISVYYYSATEKSNYSNYEPCDIMANLLSHTLHLHCETPS